MFAIVSDVKTDHKAIAICDVWRYDVWGNKEDGWQVNDRAKVASDAEFVAICHVSNIPRFPGAKDDYRKFPNEPSFSVNVVVSFELDESAHVEYFGHCVISDHSDGVQYCYETDEGKPIGEIAITGWRAME